jgi:hypothetical protein
MFRGRARLLGTHSILLLPLHVLSYACCVILIVLSVAQVRNAIAFYSTCYGKSVGALVARRYSAFQLGGGGDPFVSNGPEASANISDSPPHCGMCLAPSAAVGMLAPHDVTHEAYPLYESSLVVKNVSDVLFDVAQHIACLKFWSCGPGKGAFYAYAYVIYIYIHNM